LLNLADAVEAEAKVRQRIRFTTEQMIDAMSPSNFLATNPDAIQRLLDTKGESLRTGILNALQDLGKGKVSQTDETAFEVGKIWQRPKVLLFSNVISSSSFSTSL